MRTGRTIHSLTLAGLLAAITGCATTQPASTRFNYASISQPGFFPILPWDPNNGWQTPFTPTKADGLESIADCNFNMAGFVLPQDLPQYEQLGLGALVLPSETGLHLFIHAPVAGVFPTPEIDHRVKDMVEAAGCQPGHRWLLHHG